MLRSRRNGGMHLARAALHLEAARQLAALQNAAIDAGIHRREYLVEASIDLTVNSPDTLVRTGQLGNIEPGA